MRRISMLQNVLDAKDTENFTNIFLDKTNDKDMKTFIMEKLQNSDILVKLRQSLKFPEMDDLILEKWLHGSS